MINSFLALDIGANVFIDKKSITGSLRVCKNDFDTFTS